MGAFGLSENGGSGEPWTTWEGKMEIAEPDNDGVRRFPTLQEALKQVRSVRQSLKGRGMVKILQTKRGQFWVYFSA